MGNSNTSKNTLNPRKPNFETKSSKNQLKLQLHKTLTGWLKVARAKMYILETHLQTCRPNANTSESASALILEIMNCTFSVHSTIGDLGRKLSEKSFVKYQLDQFTLEANGIQSRLKGLLSRSLKVGGGGEKKHTTYLNPKNRMILPESLRHSQKLLWKSNRDIEICNSFKLNSTHQQNTNQSKSCYNFSPNLTFNHDQIKSFSLSQDNIACKNLQLHPARKMRNYQLNSMEQINYTFNPPNELSVNTTSIFNNNKFQVFNHEIEIDLTEETDL